MKSPATYSESVWKGFLMYECLVQWPLILIEVSFLSQNVNVNFSLDACGCIFYSRSAEKLWMGAEIWKCNPCTQKVRGSSWQAVQVNLAALWQSGFSGYPGGEISASRLSDHPRNKAPLHGKPERTRCMLHSQLTHTHLQAGHGWDAQHK